MKRTASIEELLWYGSSIFDIPSGLFSLETGFGDVLRGHQLGVEISGKRLFKDGSDTMVLALADAKTFRPNVVYTYQSGNQ